MNFMKTNMKSFKAFFILLFASALNGNAQLMNFSQYQMTPMLNNPSLIAKGEELKVDAGYRNQFGGLSGNFGTPFISAYKPLYLMGKDNEYKKFGAAGVQFVNDRTGYNGSLATTGFSLTYAHIANLSQKDQLAMGLSVGYFQRRVDFGNLTSGNQWDSYNGAFDGSKTLNENLSATERRSFPLVNAGLTYMRYTAEGRPFASFSVAANSLNTPNVSLNKGETLRELSLNFQGNIAAYENQTILLQPTFRHIQEGKQSQTNIGSYLYYKFGENASLFKNGNIGLGLWYSNNNAAVAALEMNMKDWAMGFSYDFLISSLGELNTRTGAPEFIIGFRKYVGKAKKAVVPDPALITNPAKVEDKPAQPAADVNSEEAKKKAAEEAAKAAADEAASKEAQAADEAKKAAQAAEDAKKELAAKEAAAQAGAKDETKKSGAEKEMSQLDLEKERARKRQVYMTPLGFRGTDPFGGTKVALTKQERAFLSKSVKFKLNKYEISTASAKHLDNVAKVLRKHPNLKIEVKGFGCDLGTEEANLKLSQSRANIVKAYLVKRKVPSRQLRAIGLGTLKPEDDIKVD
jgi:type IX secretion system PorP/SprF family membrane protein